MPIAHKQLLPLLAALSTAALLASCNSSTRHLERPNLPAAPGEFGKPVALPSPVKGKSIKTFALENRAAAIAANRRLKNDAEFYGDVYDSYASKDNGQ